MLKQGAFASFEFLSSIQLYSLLPMGFLWFPVGVLELERLVFVLRFL